MSFFGVIDPFLTTFYYVEKRNGIFHKNRGVEFEKSYVPLHGGKEGQELPKPSLVINEWSLKDFPLTEDETRRHFS